MEISQDALAEIARIVGPEGIVSDEDSDAYLTDERGLFHGNAALIALPDSASQLSRIVSLCNRARIGIVPQGGNTGYCGGATPDQTGSELLINLSRMDKIVEIDPAGMTITVEAGTVLSDIQAAAAEHNVLFPLSMGSESSCQIGGCLSTNAGGLAVLRYGTARDLMLGLEAVLPDGQVWSDLSTVRKDNTGYDLKQLFVGSEGTLGIITAAVLRLFPMPRTVQTTLFAVPDVAAACGLLQLARGIAGDSISAFEYLSATSLRLVNEHGLGGGAGVGAQVLLELANDGEEANLQATMEGIYERGLAAKYISDAVISTSEQQRRKLWRLRETIPEAERRAGGSIKHDISVPLKRMAAFATMGSMAVTKASANAKVSIFGHLGDGNLHYNVMAPTGTDFTQFRTDCEGEISTGVHNLAVALGGSFSAEHGVGQLKRGLLAEHKGELSLRLMRSLKSALDPAGIMNPGKVV